MKGLELSERFYEAYGRQMLHEQFPDFESLIAVGLCGSGSECFGFDDDISADHDFEPGFCLFLPGEDVIDRRTCFLLERAYSKLPKSFEGYHRSVMLPVGGNRHGVIRMDDFFLQKVGEPDGVLSVQQWLTTEEFFLAEAVNGKVFRDDLGAFSAVRERLSRMPEDIRKKKLSGELLTMAQAGQYNYNRCLRHGETGAAQLAAVRYTEAAMHVIFLLNGVYMPYYKWRFRALRDLPLFAALAEPLEFLISSENDPSLCETKYSIIEDIAAMVIAELQSQSLTKAVCGDLEKHAYAVNDAIRDAGIRNLHIFAGV